MAYDNTKDFISLIRFNGTTYAAARMPSLDFMAVNMAALGLISLTVGNVAPTVLQDTTAWLDTATTSHESNGTLKLWDGAAYVNATPKLYGKMIVAQSNL